MKKVKVKLDKDAMRQFAIDHSEKIVFGVILLCFLAFVYRAIGREKYVKTPETLKLQAVNVEERLASKTDVTLDREAKDYLAMLKHSRTTPRKGSDFGPVTDWRRPLYPKLKKRKEPKFFPVQDLTSTVGVAAFEAPRLAIVRSADTDARRQRTEGRRWVALFGKVLVAAQTDVYLSTFEGTVRDNKMPSLEEQIPVYLGYTVERVEIDSRGNEVPNSKAEFVSLTMHPEELKRNGGRGREELVPEVFLDPLLALVFPLTKLKEDRWGVHHLVSHEKIPFRRPNALRGQGVGHPGEEAPGGGMLPGMEGEDMLPGMGRGGMDPGVVDLGGMGPGMMGPGMMEPGMMEPGMRGVGPDGQMQPVLPRTDFDEEPEEQTTAEEAKPEDDVDNPFIRTEDGRLRPKYYLFRFLDYKVAPGKRYKYRVQLALRNPSYQMDERLLQTPDVGLTRSRRTKWTEFTDEVFVPRDDRILLDRVVVSASASVEPKAEVILLKWLADYGKEAFLKQRIVRGQFAKFFEEKFDLTTIPEKRGGVLLDAAHQMRNRLKEDDSLIPVEFNTATTLLDVLGGQRMVRRFGRKTISLSAPSKILLMDPDGRLVVQTEAGDLAEAGKFEEKKEEEEDPRNNMGLPGGPMGEGYMPEDYEGMGLPGMGMEEMPPGAGGRKTGPTRRSSTRGNSSRNPRTGGRPPGA